MKLPLHFFLLALVLFSPLYVEATDPQPKILKGPYLGQKLPGTRAEMFAPGIASTGLHDDMGPAFSPDGNEVFFRIAGKPYGIITTMKQVNGTWTQPDLAFWSGQYADGFVYHSYDGKKLYFGSKRPVDDSNQPARQSHIWETERTAAGYGKPRRIETPFADDQTLYMAGLSAQGNVYINHRIQIDGTINFDLYQCQVKDGKLKNPQKIDLGIDRKYMAFGGAVDPNERYMVISIRNMEDSLGDDDLYVSFRNVDETWSRPIHLGDKVNSTRSDSWPRISPDGKFLFFVSWRYNGESFSEKPLTYEEVMAKKTSAGYGWGADVYWVSTQVIEQLKPEVVE